MNDTNTTKPSTPLKTAVKTSPAVPTKKSESVALGISIFLHAVLALSLGVSSWFDSANEEQDIDVVTLMEYRPASARSENKTHSTIQKVKPVKPQINNPDDIADTNKKTEEQATENNENDNMVATGDSDIGSDLKGRAPRNATERYLAEVRDRILRLQTYPNASKALREEGLVKLRLTVDKTGSLVKIELIEASPYKRLNDAAMRAATKASPFKPFPDEVAFETWRITLPVQFTLAQN